MAGFFYCQRVKILSNFAGNCCQSAIVSLIPEMSSSRAESALVRDLTVRNQNGIHARPAAMFVKLASEFKGCEIFVEKDGERVNGKSIMGLMMLAAGPGSILKIEISGKDAIRAMEQISALLERKFDED